MTDENADVKFIDPRNQFNELSKQNNCKKILTTGYRNAALTRQMILKIIINHYFQCMMPMKSPSDGSLIYTDYGKGRFVYSGLVFFRELPAGVPGAYRLFANLIAKPGANNYTYELKIIDSVQQLQKKILEPIVCGICFFRVADCFLLFHHIYFQ